MTKTNIEINKLFDTFVITQSGHSEFFISGEDTIIISIANLSTLLKFLLFRNFLSPKVLEGVLDEYYNRES